MDVLQHLQETKNLAHAYLLRGNVDVLMQALKSFVFAHEGNTQSPDIYIEQFETFTIADARRITSFAQFRPVGTCKYIVLGAQSLTDEAQHALLKVTEDGVGRSVFFFAVPHGVFLLPTLISRCVVLKNSNEETENNSEGEEFLSLPYNERLHVAEKFGKDGDREGARLLVRSLLMLADTKQFDKKKLRDLLEADHYLKLSGSSPKSIVGHLALVL